MHDYMVSCILLLHLALCFFPTVRESIRKDPRPIFGSQPTGRGPVLSISPTHMCLATHFISCIIHKHTHTISVLFRLPLHLHSKTPMLCSAAWPFRPHHRQCGLGETECVEKDMWAQNTYRVQKKSTEKESDAEKVWTAAQSLSGPPSDTLSDDDK